MHAVEDSGQMAGRMYAISTVGSLLGTFAASLLLIPLVGTQRTFLTFALLCTLVSSEEHTSELQSRQYLVCRLLLEKNKYLTQPPLHSIFCPNHITVSSPL